MEDNASFIYFGPFVSGVKKLFSPSLTEEKSLPNAENVNKIIKINVFIYLKWIVFILSLNIIQISAKAEFLPQNLKRIDPNQYISDYEEYNESVINTKENPKFKAKKNHTVAQKAVQKIANILNKEMKLSPEKSDRLAPKIAFAAKKYKIDPRIMISIIKVESNFKQEATNLESCKRTKKIQCGDYSLAQINYESWSVQFPKMGRKELDLQRLKTDESYALFRMAEILSILKNQHSKNDPTWFARYHSATDKHKKRYIKELKNVLKKVIKLGPTLLADLNSDQISH